MRHPAIALALVFLAAVPAHAEVARATLSNGLRVVVVPDPLAPVVTTELSYLAGSNDAPEGFPGTAHALEHMMFRGSADLDRDQLAELGALLGGIYNASTTETVTTYTYTVAATDLPLVLRSERARMAGLTLAEADWAQERGAIEQEVSRDLSSPFYVYSAQTQGLLFAGTPYDHDALGTRPSFDRTDAALLRRFYETWYAPNNAILVIAGAVDPQAAIAQAQEAFGDIPARAVPAHAAFTLGPVTARTIELPTDFSVGLVTLAFRMPGLTEAEFATADILGDVLADRRGKIAGLRASGRALSTGFNYTAKSGVGFGLAFAAFPAGGDPAAPLADLRAVIADMVRDGVDPELVETSKRAELSQLAFASDSISGLAHSWTQALAFANLASPDDIARAYSAVTPDAVNRLAARLLGPEEMVTGILIPRNAGAAVGSGGFGAAESFAATPDHPVTMPGWAASALAELRLPAPTEPPVDSVLPNGMRLVVQPEQVGHTVSVYGQIRSEDGVQEPPGKEGVAALTGRMLVDLGNARPADPIEVTLGVGPSFSVRVETPQFEAGMRLLAANELHPVFSPEAFAVARRQTAQRLAGTQKTPSYLAERTAVRALTPEGDVLRREATAESVAALDLADIAAYHAAAYRPDLTTLVVVGDVTPEQARRVVEATFGGWRAAGPTPSLLVPAVPANPASVAHVPNPSSLQDSVTLAQAVLLPVASPERYTLELGNVILGSGFSSRLYRDLRVRTGYVYSVSSGFEWLRARALYAVSFGADPESVAAARSLALRDIREMQTTDVDATELRRAKIQVLRRLALQRGSVGAIARGYLRQADLGLPLDNTQVAAKRYLEITAPEIREAFAKWVRPDGLAEVVQGPPVP